MKHRKPVSEAVKHLEVEKDAFDRVLKKLIATPPIRRADPLPSKRKK